MSCHVHRLGRVEYGEAYRLQCDLARRRLLGEIPDSIVLVEHPPTITIGKSGRLENVLVSKEELQRLGVSLFFTDRGGDATYHGPGQLVVYPIIDLRQRGRDIHAYVYDLEETVIRTLARFSIEGSRNSHAGVWVGDRQIAAIGIAVKRWITMHGISLNVDPYPAHFSLINPCGLAGVPVTSICALAGHGVSIEEVMDNLVAGFAEVFGAVIEDDLRAVGAGCER